jgi:hypothetical protein
MFSDTLSLFTAVRRLHVRLVPRYAGDDDATRGSVRRFFPEKVNYW